jgi:hypothetical protein
MILIFFRGITDLMNKHINLENLPKGIYNIFITGLNINESKNLKKI